MKRFGSMCAVMIILTVLLTGTGSAAPAEDAALTLMVYMCGSNLESTAGVGSADLDEMLGSHVDSRVQVIVMTGGSRIWHKEGIADAAAQIHRISASGMETLDMAGSAEAPANMGDPATLTGFIDYALQKYPAEKYALVLWDHGSGPLGGVCVDELHGGDMLTLEEIAAGLAASGLPGKMSWIGFDACLMASLEVACTVAPYAEFMVASQNTEPGTGWDYSFLRGIEKDADGRATGKRIVQSFLEKTAGFGEMLTLSCIDLGKIPAVISAMDDFFTPLSESMTEEAFPEIYAICSSTPGFGRAGQAGEPGLDLVDLGVLIHGLRKTSKDSAQLSETLEQAVVCAGSNGTETSGLSVYHPLQNTAYYMAGWKNDYGALSGSEGYKKYINAFGKLLTQGSQIGWTGMQTLGGSRGEDGRISFALPLTEAQARDFGMGRLLILKRDFRWNGEDNGYAIAAAATAELDEQHMLHATFDGRFLYAENSDGETFGPITPALRADGRMEVLASAAYAATSWQEQWMHDSLIYVLEEDLSDERPEVEHVLIWDEFSKVYSSRMPYDEKRYSSVEFYGFCRELPDLTGEIPGFNDWNRLYTSDETLNFPSDWHFTLTNELSAGEELLALFEITDIYGNTRCSRPVIVENNERTPITVANPVMGNDEVLVALSGELINAPARQALELNVAITNLTEETKAFSIWNMAVNGDKKVSDLLMLSWDIEGGRTKHGRMMIDALQLAGIDAIRNIRFDLQIGSNFNNRGEIRYELENCDLSVIHSSEQQPAYLAETTVRGIQWQLLGIRMDENGDLDLTLRIQNHTNHTFDPYCPNSGVNIGDIQLFGNYFSQQINVAAGVSQDYTFHLTNTLGAFTFDIDGDWGYDEPGWSGMVILTDRYLQRHGISEIRNIKFYCYEDETWIPIELALQTPWPVPDDGRQRQGETWTGALPEIPVMDHQQLKPMAETEEYELKLERIYTGRKGFAVCMEVTNRTDRFLELTVQELLANGQTVDLTGNDCQTDILPGTTSGWILASSRALPTGTALEMIGFTLRCTERRSDDPPMHRDQMLRIRLPENIVLGQTNDTGLEAKNCEVQSETDPVPENTALFEFETRYVCIEAKFGSFQDKTTYLGEERFLVFHADGSAEYLIDRSKPRKDWWTIRDGRVNLYNSPRWIITNEEGKLICRYTGTSRNETLIFATEAEAAALAAEATASPAPAAETASSGNAVDIRMILMIAGAVVLVILLMARRKKK